MGVILFFLLAYIGEKVPDSLQGIFKTISKYSYPAYLLHHVIMEQICSRFENKYFSLFDTYFLFCIVGIAIILFTVLFNKIFFWLEGKIKTKIKTKIEDNKNILLEEKKYCKVYYCCRDYYLCLGII